MVNTCICTYVYCAYIYIYIYIYMHIVDKCDWPHVSGLSGHMLLLLLLFLLVLMLPLQLTSSKPGDQAQSHENIAGQIYELQLPFEARRFEF